MQVATERRLRDELNMKCELEFVYRFAYQAEFGDSGSENELCHVYLGRAPLEVDPNTHEIDAIRFISAAELDREFAESPETLTPWFAMEWQALTTQYRDQLAAYLES